MRIQKTIFVIILATISCIATSLATTLKPTLTIPRDTKAKVQFLSDDYCPNGFNGTHAVTYGIGNKYTSILYDLDGNQTTLSYPMYFGELDEDERYLEYSIPTLFDGGYGEVGIFQIIANLFTTDGHWTSLIPTFDGYYISKWSVYDITDSKTIVDIVPPAGLTFSRGFPVNVVNATRAYGSGKPSQKVMLYIDYVHSPDSDDVSHLVSYQFLLSDISKMPELKADGYGLSVSRSTIKVGEELEVSSLGDETIQQVTACDASGHISIFPGQGKSVRLNTSTMQPGVNILRCRMSDGRYESVKIIASY